MTNGTLTFRSANSFGAIPDLAGVWDGLWRANDPDNIFSSFGFARAWWAAFGRGRVLKIVVGEDSRGQIQLIAPLYSEESGTRHLKVIGDFRADYTNLLLPEAVAQPAQALFRWLRSEPGWSLLQVKKIPGTSALARLNPPWNSCTNQYLKRLRMLIDLRHPPELMEVRATHPILDRKRLEELAGLLAGKNYRKHTNWFSRQGDLRMETHSDPAKCEALVELLSALHIREWAAKGQTSQFARPEEKTFYRHLVAELAPLGAIRIDVLTLNSAPVAMHFGFNWNQRIYYYKPAFDPQYASHSPGKLLLAYVLSRAAADGFKEVDLLNGLEDYKAAYASALRTTTTLNVYRSRLDYLLLMRRFIKG